MPSIQAHVMNFVFRCMPHDKPGQAHDYEAERRLNGRKPPRPPRGVAVSPYALGGLNAELIEKPGNDKGLVLYIHGGGFTVGSARERRGLCQYIAARFGWNCLAFDYRLAPEHLWPAQIDDCLTAYTTLLDTGTKPKDMVFMGESAGGTLALSLALLAKERGLPQPKAVAAFSPCVTHAEPLPSHTTNIKTDHMLRDAVAKGQIKVVFGDGTTEEILRRPVTSPLYGDYTDLPSIFLSASDTEVLLDDSRALYEKLKAEGHRTELDIRHGVCHAFQMFYAMPEAKAALAAAFDFIGTCG